MRPRSPLAAKALAAFGLAALAVAALNLAADDEDEMPAGERSLTVASWGGAYARASRAAVLDPFAAETGVTVQLTDYNGGLAEVRTQVQTGHVHWDLVDFDSEDLLLGCEEGLLVPFPVEELPPAADGTPAEEDYPPGHTTECGSAMLFFSFVVAYRSDGFPGEPPTKLADFFDLEAFPGRRGVERKPKVNLEMALMADGVAREDVYATLSTPAGMDRAFAKLDVIKPHIVWWQTGAQPPQLLADREVAMTTAPNGRIFNARFLEQQPFAVIWDGHVLNSGGFGIVAGTRNLDAARALVEYSARPEVMGRLSAYIAYSPTRFSSPTAPKHLATGTPMPEHLPTSPAHRATALAFDINWWADNGDELNERFLAWLAQ